MNTLCLKTRQSSTFLPNDNDLNIVEKEIALYGYQGGSKVGTPSLVTKYNNKTKFLSSSCLQSYIYIYGISEISIGKPKYVELPNFWLLNYYDNVFIDFDYDPLNPVYDKDPTITLSVLDYRRKVFNQANLVYDNSSETLEDRENKENGSLTTDYILYDRNDHKYKLRLKVTGKRPNNGMFIPIKITAV